MYVIQVSLQVGFVSQDMVPKPVLPYPSRTADSSVSSAIGHLEQVYALGQLLASWINDHMKMVG